LRCPVSSQALKCLGQVLGDIRAAYDVTKTDCIIVGKDGLLVSPRCMPRPRLHSPVT
jgi:hypothetical protein